jgi:uncharacterized repeat protein (TIGR01451 family)
MNRRRFCILLTMVIALLMMAGLLALIDSSLVQTVHAQGTIRYVASGGNCGGASPCYSTVQAAVDAAQEGDEIRVAAGTYTGINNQGGLAQVVYVDKSLTIRGGYTTANWTIPNPDVNRTELNAQTLGRVMVITDAANVAIEGLRLTYGNATGLGGEPNSPFPDKDAGGGLYVLESTVTLSHTSVLSSVTSSSGIGGGVYMRRGMATAISCTVQGNSSRHGGGLYLNAMDATLIRNTIQGNTVTGTSEGSAVHIRSGSHVTLSDNTIQNNACSSSLSFGTVYIKGSDVIFTRNRVINNTKASAIYAEFGNAITMTGNTVQGHSGTGVFAYGVDSVLISNTIADNDLGVSIRHGGYSAITVIEDNLIQNNRNTAFSAQGGGIYLNSSGRGLITLTHNIIQDNVSGLDSVAPSGNGGGVYIADKNVTLQGNVIRRNVANEFCSFVGCQNEGRGGGIYVASKADDAMLINNIITNNRAEGLGSGVSIVGSAPILYHNTIANNSGAGDPDAIGVYVAETSSDQVAQPKLYNTIIANQTTGVYVSGDVLNVAVIDGVLWWGNSTPTAGGGGFIITNETSGAPAFVNPGGYDYHIGPGSAAIDAGVDKGITDDVDGETRPHYNGYDLGADEWWPLVAVKRATPDTAEPGDVITYTLILTNTTGTAMTVSLTDTLPSQVSYLGPLAYNNGSGGYASGVLTWSGTVFTTEPTLITYPVQVALDVSYGTTIPNTADVNDAYGLFQTDPALVLISSESSTNIYLPLVLKN